MASVLQVATIKPQDGAANAIEIANSSANVTINNLAGGTIGSGVAGGSGLTEHGRIGKICWLGKQTTSTSLSGSGQVGTADSDGWELIFNADTNMYTTANTGVTVALAGTYLVNFSAYFYAQTSTSGYMEVQLMRKPSGGSYDYLDRTYNITNMYTGGDSNAYTNNMSTAIISLNANDEVDLRFNRSHGSYTLHGVNTNLRIVYIDSSTFTHTTTDGSG